MVEINLADIVPGDWVKLSAGDMIPGDCQILQSKDLFISQSALTGEGLRVARRDSPICKRLYILFQPCLARSLCSRNLIVKGMCRSLALPRRTWPPHRRLRRFGRNLPASYGRIPRS